MLDYEVACVDGFLSDLASSYTETLRCWTRIKTALAEAQKTSTNSVRDAMCALDASDCIHSTSGISKLRCKYVGECPHKQYP